MCDDCSDVPAAMPGLSLLLLLGACVVSVALWLLILWVALGFLSYV